MVTGLDDRSGDGVQRKGKGEEGRAEKFIQETEGRQQVFKTRVLI